MRNYLWTNYIYSGKHEVNHELIIVNQEDQLYVGLRLYPIELIKYTLMRSVLREH